MDRKSFFYFIVRDNVCIKGVLNNKFWNYDRPKFLYDMYIYTRCFLKKICTFFKVRR